MKQVRKAKRSARRASVSWGGGQKHLLLTVSTHMLAHTLMSKQRTRAKRTPQRTCIACRQVAGKNGLLRLVRHEAGIAIDHTGKQAGRGAYLHATRDCWERALAGRAIASALRTRLLPADRELLREFAASLPQAEDDAPKKTTEG